MKRIYACTSGQWSYTHTGTRDYGQVSIVSDDTRRHEQFYAKALTSNGLGWVKRTTQRIVYGTAPCAERWPEREYLY